MKHKIRRDLASLLAVLLCINNILYYGCGNGKLYAFDIHTGALIWSFSSDNPVNTPVLNDEAIFFTSGQYLYKIE